MKKSSLISLVALSALIALPACGGSDDDKDAAYVSNAASLNDRLQNGKDAIIGEDVTITANQSIQLNNGATLTIRGKLDIGSDQAIELNNGAALYLEGDAELAIKGVLKLNGGNGVPADLHVGQDAVITANNSSQIEVNCGRLYVDGAILNVDSHTIDLKINGNGSCATDPNEETDFVEVYGYANLGNVELNANGSLYVIGGLEANKLHMNGGKSYVGLSKEDDENDYYYNLNQTLEDDEYNLDVREVQLNNGYIHNYDGWFVNFDRATMNGGRIRNENKDAGSFTIGSLTSNNGTIDHGDDIGVVEVRQ